MLSRAMIFDIGGVLEITPRTSWREAWENHLGMKVGTLDEFLEPIWCMGALNEIGEHEVLTRISATLDIAFDQAKRLMSDAWKEYLGSPNLQLIDYLRQVRSGHRTGIISNSFTGAREREESMYGFSRLFDVIIYSHEVGVQKPSKEIYELACQELKVKAGGAVFIDDVETNVEAAISIGMHGILHRDTDSTIQKLSRWLGTSEQALTTTRSKAEDATSM